MVKTADLTAGQIYWDAPLDASYDLGAPIQFDMFKQGIHTDAFPKGVQF